jgi:hypothetical protein
MIRFGLFLALLIQVFLATPSSAHEMRPAYLDMRERVVFAASSDLPGIGRDRGEGVLLF